MKGKKYIFAAGGTGGHINPALAVAGYIKRQEPDAEILFIGTAEKMEVRLVPAAGYPIQTIPISGFQRGKSMKALMHNVKLVAQLQQSTQKTKQILREFQPDAVLGFGGYVSGPVLRAAAKAGIPTAVHEANSFPGKANKMLARLVDAVMLTNEDARQHIQPKNPAIVTGLPIREELLQANRILSRFELNIPDDMPLVLSMGGSLGARPINEAVAQMIVSKYPRKDCWFIHAAGNDEACDRMKASLQKHGLDAEHEPSVTILPYVEDMARCLSAADVVICRAGASSVNEFQALGKASILIPAPHLAENHQYYNAKTLADRQAAILLEQAQLSGTSLTQQVDRLLSDEKWRESIAKNARGMAVTDANERIYQVVQDIMRKGK